MYFSCREILFIDRWVQREILGIDELVFQCPAHAYFRASSERPPMPHPCGAWAARLAGTPPGPPVGV